MFDLFYDMFRWNQELFRKEFTMSDVSVKLIRNLPVWKFFYKGSHSKPIRTTLAVVSNTPNVVTGYVLRRGNEVCNRLQDAKIHSFKKSEIACLGQVCPTSKKSKNANKTTLTKHSIVDLIATGA
jgi:hypothetical protein